MADTTLPECRCGCGDTRLGNHGFARSGGHDQKAMLRRFRADFGDESGMIGRFLDWYDDNRPTRTADEWGTIRQLVAWLDQKNGSSDHETAMRLMKLSEEVGETMQAYIGAIGQNPRKGVTHSPADVADELCDVIVTAMVALDRFTPDPEQHLAARIQRIADRSRAMLDVPAAEAAPDGAAELR
ncbi:MazG-like family protein [Kitasatospora sp. MAP5-34]|uniref:MazG-like family protein n=1 Tax=Kitasatospora sp. MAP5-34 TaxID=3035102 RepID=UPI0024769460|nr:MazG-like family protein [Kitasatospora sp. MAP5-34]MDH6576848.1 hypothetical protein [Kitasatospora sp. MAP5-34]